MIDGTRGHNVGMFNNKETTMYKTPKLGRKNPKFQPTGQYHTEWWSYRIDNPTSETMFVHSAVLVDPQGNVVARANVGYCNRTWECYPGDSVRSKLADKIDSMPSLAKRVEPLVMDLRRSYPAPRLRPEHWNGIAYARGA